MKDGGSRVATAREAAARSARIESWRVGLRVAVEIRQHVWEQKSNLARWLD